MLARAIRSCPARGRAPGVAGVLHGRPGGIAVLCRRPHRRAVPLPPAQDFKRVGGMTPDPNTGGKAPLPLPWLPRQHLSGGGQPDRRTCCGRTGPRKPVSDCRMLTSRLPPAAGSTSSTADSAIRDPSQRASEFRSANPLHAAATGKLADFGELRWRDGVRNSGTGGPSWRPGRDVVVGSEAEGVLHAGTTARRCARSFRPVAVLSRWGTADLSAARAHAYGC